MWSSTGVAEVGAGASPSSDAVEWPSSAPLCSSSSFEGIASIELCPLDADSGRAEAEEEEEAEASVAGSRARSASVSANLDQLTCAGGSASTEQFSVHSEPSRSTTRRGR